MIWTILILLFVTYSVGIFFIPWWIALGIVAFVQIVLMFALRVRLLKICKSLLLFSPVIVTTALFNYFFMDWNDVLLISARLFLVSHMTFIFATTMPKLKFIRGLQNLFGRRIAITAAVALTFIPVVLSECTRIKQAMNAKGCRRNLRITTRIFMYNIVYRASVLSLTLDAKGYQ